MLNVQIRRVGKTRIEKYPSSLRRSIPYVIWVVDILTVVYSDPKGRSFLIPG